jgi:mannose-6-phosphate isomerase
MPAPADSDRPEDWLGSATAASHPLDRTPTTSGVSSVRLQGEDVLLTGLLEADPESMIGPALAQRLDRSTGLLVKLLDTAVRVRVHWHPSRDFARRILGSYFGKTEACIVLATREIEGSEPPNLRIGFRDEVDRDRLADWIEAQDMESLRAAMHMRDVNAGDAIVIPPGVPHVLGAGMFAVEVQEPTNFSIAAEYGTFPEKLAHLGRGWDTMLESVDYGPLTDADVAALWHEPETIREDDRMTERRLFRRDLDPFFRASRLIAHGATTPAGDSLGVWIVVSGRGAVRGRHTRLAVERGDVFLVPAAGANDLQILPEGELEAIVCRPPDPEMLAPAV